MRKIQMLGLSLAVTLGTACQTSDSGALGPASPAPPVPRRVVSLIPSATELIYEVGAGKTLVGVTTNDSHPPEVRHLPKVGDQTIDPERLLSLRPDLVVLDTEFNRDESKYRRLGLPVLALESKRLSDISRNLRLLGQRLGQKDSGEAAAQKFEAALAELPKLSKRDTVFVEVWGSPLMTVGNQSLPNDLLEQLGLKNAYSDHQGYFQVDPEDVVARRPGIVILPSANRSDRSVAAKWLAKAGVPVKVVVLDGDTFTTPSPRVLDGLKFLVSQLQD
jgi:ABC-type Fe3+-hydroxamate transport system substrate-binding protein